MHRLNRAEYANAIRDLLALDVDPSALLPPDDAAYGFDNIADALGISPVLLERYLTAAGKISSLAVGDPTPARPARRSASARTRRRTSTSKACRSARSAASSRRRRCRSTATYDFSIRLFRTNLGVVRGLEYEHQLEYTVDGARVHLSTVGGDDDFKANLKNMTKAGDDVEARAHIRMPLKAGPHVITAAFLERTDAINPLRLQPFIRSSNDTLDTIGHPHLDTFTVTGPFNPTGPGDTPSRRKIFVCRPAGKGDEDGCARRIIATLARRAYRGQATPGDLERLHDFYVPDGPRQRGPSKRASRRRCSAFWRARSSRSASSAIRRTCRRHGLSRQRSRAGVAAVVLPVEQHPGRSAARRVASLGTLHTPAVLEPAGAADAGRSEERRAGARTSRGSGCTCAT